jgi:hypothetical protein
VRIPGPQGKILLLLPRPQPSAPYQGREGEVLSRNSAPRASRSNPGGPQRNHPGPRPPRDRLRAWWTSSLRSPASLERAATRNIPRKAGLTPIHQDRPHPRLHKNLFHAKPIATNPSRVPVPVPYSLVPSPCSSKTFPKGHIFSIVCAKDPHTAESAELSHMGGGGGSGGIKPAAWKPSPSAPPNRKER